MKQFPHVVSYGVSKPPFQKYIYVWRKLCESWGVAVWNFWNRPWTLSQLRIVYWMILKSSYLVNAWMDSFLRLFVVPTLFMSNRWCHESWILKQFILDIGPLIKDFIPPLTVLSVSRSRWPVNLRLKELPNRTSIMPPWSIIWLSGLYNLAPAVPRDAKYCICIHVCVCRCMCAELISRILTHLFLRCFRCMILSTCSWVAEHLFSSLCSDRNHGLWCMGSDFVTLYIKTQQKAWEASVKKHCFSAYLNHDTDWVVNVCE